MVVGLGLVVGLIPGCGSPPEKAAMETSAEAQGLKNLGAMYRIVSETLKRPPKGIGELRTAEAQVPGGFSSLGEPNVAIYFGAEMPGVAGKTVDSASETILAYDRMVPRQGGYVLMLDGSVRTMSSDEFKAAKKAGKTAWVAPQGS
jgi:hypothetical protein